MMHGRVYLDLTELMINPLRSGIQRVEREAIRHWSGPSKLIPCLIDAAGRVVRLPHVVLDVLCGEDNGSAEARAAERYELASLTTSGEIVSDDEVERLLNLELFFDPIRADAHLRLSQRGTAVLWYVYDFLPFLRPELFPSGTTRHCMHFLRALRAPGDRLSFLSEHTRENCAARVLRRSAPAGAWPVLDPGADGLGLERQVFAPERRDFVAIGTVEPRKNPMSLLRAFEVLWKRGADAHLTLAGRIAPEATEARAFIDIYSAECRLRVLDQPPDGTLRKVLREARAVVMPSEAEGFGLPPYEALHAGIPAIASAALPSASLMSSGAILLESMDSGSIAAAVEALLNDAAAAMLWKSAEALRLPSWADFGRKLSDWAQTA